MIEARVWLVTVALAGGCTLHPADGDGGFAEGGEGGGEDDDDDDPEATEGDDSSGAAEDDSSTGGSDPPAPDTSGDATTSGGDETTGAAGDETPGDTGAPDDLGECSNFASIDQLFTYVNTERGTYGGLFGAIAHTRWKGYPWQGEGHESFTFSVQFAWDDDLAQQAQAEAEALAAGGAPTGHQQNGSNGLPICSMAPFWIDGINTGSWKIAFAEQPSHWMQTMYESCPPTTFALSPDNQHARMGLHYHDFGGDGPAINRLGVGAAVIPDGGNGECEVWWVLQFGD